MYLPFILTIQLLFACPDPPPEISAGISDDNLVERNKTNRGGPEGDPDSLDLSPGGTMLLDMSQVIPQKSQEELAGTETVTIAGALIGSCEGGQLRIDIIEIGGDHTDQGPMIGPLTSTTPTGSGAYTLIAPKGKTVQVAALCDLDKDGKIIQGTDKLAPGISLGELTEDHKGVDLVFPGESDTPVEVGGANDGNLQPPGDKTASMPSTAAGERDRTEEADATPGEPVPPPPSEPATDANEGMPNDGGAAEEGSPTPAPDAANPE